MAVMVNVNVPKPRDTPVMMPLLDSRKPGGKLPAVTTNVTFGVPPVAWTEVLYIWPILDAGTVIVADVYPAGETPIPGVNRDALVEGLRARGHRSVVPLPAPAHLAEMVHAIARPGDYVVCLGAGNITQWAQSLPVELAALQTGGRRAAGAS